MAKSFWGSCLCFAAEDRSCQLVGARGWLATAGVAEQFCCDVFGGHSFAELGDGLEVAVAASGKANVADFVSVAGELDGSGAHALGLECFFHVNSCLANVCFCHSGLLDEYRLFGSGFTGMSCRRSSGFLLVF